MPSDQPKPGAAHYAATRDWPGYFDAVAGKGPRETLLDALDRFDAEGLPDEPLAVDLGCGEGRDTVELLRRGWHVLAIDAEHEAFRRLYARPELCCRDNLRAVVAPFALARFPPALLVNASFSLPFCPPQHFDDTWSRLVDAIDPGGRFAGQLFGDRDTWATIPDRSHHTREQVEAMLAPFEIERLDEEERDGEDALHNAKHWHMFHIVARKPPRKSEPAAPNH